MWELRKESARGRKSLRRFSLLAIAMLMAMFALTSILSPQALAADATRSGDNVSYDGHTYTLMTDTQRPSGVQSDVTGYASLDETGKKAYFILTTGDASKATTGQYVIYDFIPPSNFSNSSPPVTVAIAQAATDTTPATSTDGSEGASSCNSQFLQGIGWILCPVVNFLASGMDHLFDILSGFLVVQPAKATEDNSLFKMWGVVRNIANICFVIVFLIVIYSQITSIGISNYGIKRIMPRLIVAAILVNISFWICALAIDVSNVLGYGVHSLFTGMFGSLNTSGAYQNLTWSNVAVSVLSGTAVTALAAYGIYGAILNIPGLLITFIPTLVGVLLSVLVALLVISVRQALITCLVIISPLAFVAYLLPNTEKYFTKWRELFMTLLLVYPIFAVVFGGAQLAGMAIIQNAGGSLNLIILGMAVQIAPVVVTPLLVKVSGSLVGKIAALANNPRQAITGKTRTWAEGRAAERKARVLSDPNRNGRLVRLSRSLNDYNTGHEQSRKEYEARDGHRFARTARGRQVERLRRTNTNIGKRVTNAHEREFEELEIESRNLDVTKSNIETNMMGSRAGRELKKRMDDSGSYKKEVDNAFYRTEDGRQARARSERADVDKTNTDTKYSQSSIGRQVDNARREAERKKQRVGAELEHEWHFRNLTDHGSHEREMNLRVALDEATNKKAEVDAVYKELQGGKSEMLGGAIVQRAYEAAETATLTANRTAQATGVVKLKINTALRQNGQIYQRDSDDKIVLGADGKPVVVSQRLVNGKTLQEYARGIGKHETMFANAIAEHRSEWGKQAAAAGELIAHFNLESEQVQDLARYGKGTSVIVHDDEGNEFTFNADDEYVKEAAIDKQFKEGSYGQKMAILKETGKRVTETKPDGTVIVREGHNFGHRATAKNDAVSSGIAGLAPFVNDITYNEILKGNFNGDDSLNMHALRQIFEGRIKVDNLSGANNAALDVLGKIGKLYKSEDPGDKAEFENYKTLMFDLFADMYGKDSDNYKNLETNFDTQFSENFDATLESLKQIMENTNISRNTAVAAKKSITSILDDNGVTYRKPK